jgi:hypothetical protein
MINIPITSTFKKDGFSKAEKSTNTLTKSFKNLAISLGAALSARKIAQFTKASVKAFIEEDKAITVLSNNLQNLGLAYDIAPIEKYIREMQYATGVADGELRPAYQKLANATKSLSATQEILGLALDISAATGKSLSAVTDALSRAYLGNNTSLSRLNLGIKKADLSSKSFSEITGDLSKQFSGSAAKAADTYAGKLAILSAAAGDAQEILGGKLIQSMEILAGKDGDITKLAESFESMATYVGNVALGLADVINQFKTLGGLLPGGGFNFRDLIQGIPVVGSYLEFFFGRGEKKAAENQGKQDMLSRALAKERGMLASKNFKIQKNTTKELEKQNKLKKDSNKLDKAGSMLDLEKIQIEAALQNNLTDNEKLRLQLMKALVNENADRAEMLAGKLKESQTELAKLSNQTFNFKAPSPFDEWEDAILRMQRMLAGLSVPSLNGGSISGGQAGGGGVSGGEILATPTPIPGGPTLIPSLAPGDIRELTATEQNIFNVQVTVEGSVVTQQELEKVIVDTMVEASTLGYSTGWFRTTGQLGGL